jgi:predicted ArsR family transcriptional regulator
MLERPSNIEKRFVAADADVAVITEATVAGFCLEPRSRQDIAEMFGLSAENARGYIKQLVSGGMLKMTMPLNPIFKQQRFVNPSVEINAFS